MKWIKSAAVGLLGSLVMFLLLMLGIHGTGIAPFNLPPSAAFLEQIDLNAGPLPLLVHFGYGATWCLVLVALYGTDTTIWRGILLATGLWLFMMLVYSPLIGWGVFGVGGSGHTLSPDDPLYLGSPVKYVVGTVLLHLIYGAIIGGLNPIWVHSAQSTHTVSS
jgi:hypothetical protein